MANELGQQSVLGSFLGGRQAKLGIQAQEAELARAQRLQELLGQVQGGQSQPVGAQPPLQQSQLPVLGAQPTQPPAQALGVKPTQTSQPQSQTQALAELAIQFPERFEQVNTNLGLITQQQKDEAADFAFQLRNTPFEQRQDLIRQRVATPGRNMGDTASLEGMTEEEQNQALDVVQIAALSPEKRVDIAKGGKTGLASAKTEILPGGAVIQALPSGEVQVRDPAGNIVSGEERTRAISESQKFQLELARQKASIDVQKEAQTEAAKAGIKLSTEPQIQSAVTEAIAEVKAAQKISGEQRSNKVALDTYRVAMKGLADSLTGTNTGPFVGMTPALTSNQQIADGAVAAMAPVLKGLFRTAGEGTFTDKDQELLLKMVPTRTDTPKSREAKIQNIDAIVRSKLSAPDIIQPGSFKTATTELETPSQTEVIQFDRSGRRLQ